MTQICGNWNLIRLENAMKKKENENCRKSVQQNSRLKHFFIIKYKKIQLMIRNFVSQHFIVKMLLGHATCFPQFSGSNSWTFLLCAFEKLFSSSHFLQKNILLKKTAKFGRDSFFFGNKSRRLAIVQWNERNVESVEKTYLFGSLYCFSRSSSQLDIHSMKKIKLGLVGWVEFFPI